MSTVDGKKAYTLEAQGINGVKKVYWDLNAASLVEESIKRGEAALTENGALIALTGKYTGRSPNDKFIVKDRLTSDKIWWGKVNKPFDEAKFEPLYQKVLNHLKGRELFVQDCYVGADPANQVPIRVITEFAWHSLFVRNMFLRIASEEERLKHKPEYTIISAPSLKADPATDGTNSEAFIIPNFNRKLIIIGGTSYAGEIKKSAFTLLNFLFPQKGIMSMHCSANRGEKGDVAIFFGLSGTGKTTLSADPDRALIGDDEHGWSETGVFNFEGGCYAKVIRLSPQAEPEIYACTKRFGTVLENVVMDESTRKISLDSEKYTENTRASYPIDFIPNAKLDGRGGNPNHIIMLTCDAFGVLPPVAKLSSAQAMYHFISGYTAKVAGTERGIKEPTATFSACFGAPFMPLHPGIYAKILGEKISQNQVDCWLVNTGWNGGGYGVGERISIGNSRAIIKAILTGGLREVKFQKDAIFGFEVPTDCPGISSAELLSPRNTWKDKSAFDAKAKHLAQLFVDNFNEYQSEVDAEIKKASPVVPA